MPDQPFFTVGVPTYNRAGFLRECVGHLLQQTCVDFELIIADNCSDDDTPDVVRSFDDPRIRYVRHDRNIGSADNFLYLFGQARGRFIVINQDDDLLHHDFLQRCRACVDRDADVSLYAAPMWIGDPVSGMHADLMADPATGLPDFMLADRPAILDGPAMAVTFFMAFSFNHPCLAMSRDALANVGGYCTKPLQAGDAITEARVLFRGKLAYDPRPGALYRDHPDTVSRGRTTKQRSDALRGMFHQLVHDFEVMQIDWQAALRELLGKLTAKQRLRHYRRWVRHHAPRCLIDVGWQAYCDAEPSSSRRLKAKLFKLGPRNLLRAASAGEVQPTDSDWRPVDG